MFLHTATGRKIEIDQMRSTDVDPHDIAHSLAHLCRFGGHGRYFTSVGMHIMLCAMLAEADGESEDVQRACLAHDFCEAYLVDLPRPVKALLPQYEKLEEMVQDVIRQRFLLSEDPEVWAKVKKYDELALNIEARIVFDPPPDWASPIAGYEIAVETFAQMILAPHRVKDAILEGMEVLGMVSR